MLGISPQLLEVVIVAAFAGVFLGLIGGGGGSTYLFLLMFVLGLPVERAIGTTLALSTITALAGVLGHWRNGNVDGKSALYLGAAAVIGVVSGAALTKQLSPDLFRYLIVAAFVLTGLMSISRIRQVKEYSKRKVTRRWILLPWGLGTGFVSGGFGLTETAPLSSFLVSFAQLSPAIAIGTTLTTILVASAVGATVHFQSIDFSVLLILGVGSVTGAYLGSKITSRISKRALAITLAVLALAFGIYLAFHFTGFG
jgi:uncharacterized membrane protein YfcA